MKKLISITLAALLLLSISGCQESGKNDKVTVMQTLGTVSTENTNGSESVPSDSEKKQPVEEPAETVSEPDKSEEPVSEEAAGVSEEETDDPYGGYVKEDYQDPWEFIGGVQQTIKESATVEQMYRKLEEFDIEGRIDKVLLSFEGVSITEGNIWPGMWCKVYYDDEASWFEFTI